MQYLLFVGSGFKRKGLATLTGLVYPEQNEEIHLIAAGRDKPDYYKNLQRTTGFQRQCFIGVQPDIENFAASDIFVLPTIYDPFSNATLPTWPQADLSSTKTRGIRNL